MVGVGDSKHSLPVGSSVVYLVSEGQSNGIVMAARAIFKCLCSGEVFLLLVMCVDKLSRVTCVGVSWLSRVSAVSCCNSRDVADSIPMMLLRVLLCNRHCVQGQLESRRVKKVCCTQCLLIPGFEASTGPPSLSSTSLYSYSCQYSCQEINRSAAPIITAH